MKEFDKIVSELMNEELDMKKVDIIRKSMPGYVGPAFAKKASPEDIIRMADLKDQYAALVNKHLKDVVGEMDKLYKKYKIKSKQGIE